jgi:hypothetical protein
VEVSAINGLAVVEKHYLKELPDASERANSLSEESGAEVFGKDHKIVKRSNMSLANIFFKLQHEDTSVMRHLLVNREQEKVVDLVVEKLQ